ALKLSPADGYPRYAHCPCVPIYSLVNLSPVVDPRSFKPTPESIPPPNVSYHLKQLKDVPVNYHPLNPFTFVLRAALIYPDKIGLAHPNATEPAFYTYRIWRVASSVLLSMSMVEATHVKSLFRAQRIQNLAYALIQAGIHPGDRVAVLSPNTLAHDRRFVSIHHVPSNVLIQPSSEDAYFGVIAARAVVTPINTRLTPHEVEYILEHSGAKLILVDRECFYLLPERRVTTIVCHDTGRAGDPYEEFLSSGRTSSQERGWAGLDVEVNEDTGAVLCYTCVIRAKSLTILDVFVPGLGLLAEYNHYFLGL
ncbi:hypothetical protein ID866_614, partial [Astraeus odoratus]